MNNRKCAFTLAEVVGWVKRSVPTNHKWWEHLTVFPTLRFNLGLPRRTCAAMTGFTLTEVLITLSILGVVAAITIPNVINNFQNTINLTKLKKAYARITNTIEESLIISGCNNLGCVLQSKNVSYDNTSTYDIQLERLKVFFPEIEKNEDFKCIPKDIYSLNGYKYSASSSESIILGGMTFRNFCLNNTGLIAGSNDLSSNNDLCSKKAIGRCMILFIYTGNKNGKAIIGRNTFFMSIHGDGSQKIADGSCDPNVQDSSVATGNLPNGERCTDRIMKNGWKIDY